MLRFLFKTTAALMLVAPSVFGITSSSVRAALTTPTPSDTTGARADAIAALAALIKNEPRTLLVGDEVFPLYSGPAKSPGSMAQNMTLYEAMTLVNQRREYPEYIAGLAYSQAIAGKLTSMEAINSLYDMAADQLDRPISSDIRDTNFGRQRMTVLAMALRQVQKHEYKDTKFEVCDAKLRKLCGPGLKWSNIRQRHALYVEDYSAMAQWNDPEALHKFVPNVIGFFCYNRKAKQLLPIEIHFPDTGLAYSRWDTPNEWTLAKMGLNAAANDYHQFQHYVETHAVNVPIRVEIYRNLASSHPVAALLSHQIDLDFGIELLLSTILLTPGTKMDILFGMGATGTTRFINSRFDAKAAYTSDLPEDIAKRGLDDIPTHPYATYGKKLHTAIDRFVKRYVAVFYANNKAVRDDFELQNWAKACSDVPHLTGFPSALTTRKELQKLLTSAVYRSMVKHHAMNGEVTWHAASSPFSPYALWHPLPTHKQTSPESEPLKLIQFAPPVALLPTALGFPAIFYRPPMANQTVLEVFRAAPFSTEPRLAEAITDYEAAMADAEAFITKAEAGEDLPYLILAPSHLPFKSWI